MSTKYIYVLRKEREGRTLSEHRSLESARRAILRSSGYYHIYRINNDLKESGSPSAVYITRMTDR